MLSVDDIAVAYNGRNILNKTSIYVNKGEIVSLIGPNGSGKSTLLKSIMGLLPLKSGEIYFNETNISLFPCYQRANIGIGYLKQGGAVFTNLSVMENLALSLRKNILEVKNKNTISDLEEIYYLFPTLKVIKNMRSGLLSGGQKKILSLAMVLSRYPELILLDEPSSGISVDQVEELIGLFKEINIKKHTTMLVVEQNIQRAVNLAHRTYSLFLGKADIYKSNDISSFKKL
jgi:ABC-type branched-subunit amino acid transport system ATPase component